MTAKQMKDFLNNMSKKTGVVGVSGPINFRVK